MNISVILFGLSRNERCLLSITQLLEKLKVIANVSVFAALYEKKILKLNTSSEECDLTFPEDWCAKNCDITVKLDDKIVWEIIQPMFIKLKKYGDAWHNNFESLRNLLLQLYSMNTAYDLVNCPTDIFVSLRIDLEYIDSISKSDLTFSKAYVKIPSPYMPFCTEICEFFYGINDRLLICNSVDYCNIILKRFDFALSYCTKTNRPLHAEHFLKWLLKNYNIKKKSLKLKAARIRCNGKVAFTDEYMYDIWKPFISSHMHRYMRIIYVIIFVISVLIYQLLRKNTHKPVYNASSS